MESSGSLGQRIVVPLDGSAFAEEALPVAASLAGPSGVLILCHVIPRAENVLTEDGDSIAPDPRWLAEAAARTAQQYGVRCETVIASGDPAKQILTLAQQRGASTIAIASHGRGAALKMLLGSVAEEVLHKASIPVVVTQAATSHHPAPSPRLRRIVIPLDGSDLAMKAIPVAVQFAKRQRIPVLLVYAADLSQVQSPLAGYGAALSDHVYRQVMGALKDQAQRILEGAGAQLMRQGVVAAWRVLLGPPAKAIADVLAAGDLVIVASHGRAGVERLLAGSVAEDLIATGVAPVMVLHQTRPIAVTAAPARATADLATSI